MVWTSREWVRRFMRGVALVALISVMLNTPKTFEYYPTLFYWTYAGLATNTFFPLLIVLDRKGQINDLSAWRTLLSSIYTGNVMWNSIRFCCSWFKDIGNCEKKNFY